MHRLIEANINEDEVIEEFGYYPNGNIAHKTGVGVYNYHPQRLNAVDNIEWQGGMDEENATQMMLMQTVSYNHFNSVSELINMANRLKVEFIYGPDDQRRKAEYFVGDIQEEWALEKTRYYIGAYEKQVDATNNETEVHYISAGGMLVAMYVIEDGIGQYYYPHQDHLGSIIHITDENAEIVYTQSFDAWGRTRNAEDLSYEDITQRPNWLWRGYTGHEHLDEFGLINMNGRLYDPVIGRMLSPDNYVQAPGFSQSYNRYSYVWNNPLKYTDPDGEWLHIVVGAVIGGIMNVALNADNIDNFGQGLAYFAVGAVAGGLAAGIGAGVSSSMAKGGSFSAGFVGKTTISSTGFSSGFVTGFATGFTNGFISSTGNSIIQQQDLGTALKNGINNGFNQGYSAAVMGGIIGGFQAESQGKDFWTGATEDNVVVQVKPDGTVIDKSATEMVPGDRQTNRINEKYYKNHRTILNDPNNPNINSTINADGSMEVSIKLPSRLKVRGYAIQDDNIPYMTQNGRNLSLDFMNPQEDIMFFGSRYHNRPIQSFGDLFNSNYHTSWQSRFMLIR